MILNSKKLFLKGYKLLKDQDQYIENQNNGMKDQIKTLKNIKLCKVVGILRGVSEKYETI